MIDILQQFQERARQAEWQEAVTYMREVEMCNDRHKLLLLPMIRKQGIPLSLRGEVWYYLSCATEKKNTSRKKYCDIISELHQGGDASIAIERV